ncbi:hypothetical protein FE257_000071 [Aspergillus nanangensis]|uniref:AB hydrolase-1 domain-containing protein n=1 Tax=Aspergillus nanangensis TaxID=2582783 RepID=A0AAD4GYR4_ASPNN|nr:hypothetical protein FE257_000071 [Aspergillus nanangensis]
MYLTKIINGVEICYDECGSTDGPALVLLTGWAHDIALYDELLPHLASKYWVVRVCWRGHGPRRDPLPDFGVQEQVSDTIGLLESLDVDKFSIVSHSHGGWPALDIADQLGKDRVLSVLMIDQIMTPPPPFAAGLQAMQRKDSWRAARKDLFANWGANSNNQAVQDHFVYNMASFGFAMWALSCRVIRDAYERHGSPMGRMEKMESPPLILHVFSHPLDDLDYRRMHEEFRARHSWFSYADLKGETHFPDIEIPGRVAEHIDDLVRMRNKL